MRCWRRAVQLFEDSCFWFLQDAPRTPKSAPSSPALLPEGEGSIWLVAWDLSTPAVARMERGGIRERGVATWRGIPDSGSLRPGYGFWGPCLALGRPHPQPFSRREKGVFGWWARVLSISRWPGWNAVESGSVASQPCGGSRIPFHSVRATGFGVRVWLLVALIPSPSPGGRREYLVGGLGFYRHRR